MYFSEMGDAGASGSRLPGDPGASGSGGSEELAVHPSVLCGRVMDPVIPVPRSVERLQKEGCVIAWAAADSGGKFYCQQMLVPLADARHFELYKYRYERGWRQTSDVLHDVCNEILGKSRNYFGVEWYATWMINLGFLGQSDDKYALPHMLSYSEAKACISRSQRHCVIPSRTFDPLDF